MIDLRERVQGEVAKVVIGQRRVVDAVLVALGVGGHVLLEGVPGVAKTLLAAAVSRALGLDFKRVQFTPDMLPSDVTGTMALREGRLAFRPGPVFANAVLADEINRTPPKTQSALLEAMQERTVTVDGTAHELPSPFVVIATQNPIEYEGTYPLPEAQLDRFLLKIDVGYPNEADERALLILDRVDVTDPGLDAINPAATLEEITAWRREIQACRVAEEVVDYVAAIVRTTRTLPAVELGASPRAGVHLLAAARATAYLAGRDFVTPDDVAGQVYDVMRHRILLRPEAELDRYTTENAIEAAMATVPVPR